MPSRGPSGSGHSSSHSSGHSSRPSSGGSFSRGSRPSSGSRSSSRPSSRPSSGGSFGGGPRPGGGPHPGGGPRPGQGFGGGPHHGGHMPPPPGPRHRGGYHGGCCLSSALSIVTAVFIIVVAVVIALAESCGSGDDYGYDQGYDYGYNTTIVREKLNSSTPFTSNCVLADELGWFDDADQVGSDLKTFYNLTGVQPYVMFLSYDSTICSQTGIEDYLYDYYVDNIDDEDSFLFGYVMGKTADDFGYYGSVVGNNALSIMDDEAINVFYDYLNKYWDDASVSTDDMIVNAFNNTANDIMATQTATSDSQTKSKNRHPIRNIIIVAIIVIAVILIVKKTRKKKTSTDNPTKVDDVKDNPNILN